MPFLTAEDIANRACQHVGARRVASLTEGTRQANEINFCYDKLRAAELRRSVWRFATRRAQLQPFTATSIRFIPGTYAAGTTYAAGAVIQDSAGVYWLSNFASNIAHTPGVAVTGAPQWWQQYFGPDVFDVWSAGTTYNAGDMVYKSGPAFYISRTNTNLNNDPASGAPWVVMPGSPTNVIPWNFLPAGASFTFNSQAQTIFPLPHGYLRPAFSAPKFASGSTLNTSAGIQNNDWQFEGNYIVSASTSALTLRFVADVSDVSAMDPLFCEGLAARIGYEVNETLTQSNIKLQAIGQAYMKFIKDARLVNAIETGNTEPEEEEYELTRGPQGVVESGEAGGQQRQRDQG